MKRCKCGKEANAKFEQFFLCTECVINVMIMMIAFNTTKFILQVNPGAFREEGT